MSDIRGTDNNEPAEAKPETTPTSYMTAENLAAIRARNIRRLTWLDILAPSGGAEPPTLAEQALLDDYFGHFIPWQKTDDGKYVCVCCGSRVLGGIRGVLQGRSDGATSLEWSLQNGESFCRVCHWPSRGVHRNIGGVLNPIIEAMEIQLQYHPDELDLK